ncbi:MAG: FG-GAP-like repeat-containing protein, partial [Trichodesmium sp. St7_bin2_1]|nr:FG-GAP-like repeat-containing protein [Trichodesmium sp. St7_bin2_1]
ANSVFAADVDGDGDVDVLSASVNDDKIALYVNDGSNKFTEQTISTNADGACSVFAADVDGDGDVDVLSASAIDNKADVDGDGDVDVLSASAIDNKIALYETVPANVNLKSGPEFQINTHTDSSQMDPAVTALSDGGFVVTWESKEQDSSSWRVYGPWGVYGQRYDKNGEEAGDEFKINTHTNNAQRHPAVTALSDGGFVVIWQSDRQDGSSWGVYGQRYDKNGEEAGGEFPINTYTDDEQGDLAVTALDDGGFVVTWQSKGQDGSDRGVYGQRYNKNGEEAGGEFPINTYTNNSQRDPAVTALDDGGFVVTWQSEGQDGSSWGVYGQRYNKNGEEAGGEFPINTYTNSSQREPTVTALSDGGFVVTWQSEGQDGSSWGVYGQRYNKNGEKAGGEFQINTETTDDQSRPEVTALSDGGFVVTWQS